MPISKSGKLYYTAEQYTYARYETSALEYAKSQGYDLVKDGSYYHMKDHDSMIFTPRGNWFWNSRGVQGGALEFQMYYEGKTITEAVLTLAEGSNREAVRTTETLRRQSKPQPAKQPFQLPEKSVTNRQIFGYLCGTRKLDADIVRSMIDQGILYESVMPTKTGKLVHNACFVYKNPQGEPCGAYQRGTGSVAFKKESSGSDKSYGWLMKGGAGQADGVMVFEAAIDAASYASMNRNGGMSVDYLALGGVGDKPLQNYLAAHPGCKNIYMALDSDEPGKEATKRFMEKFGKDFRVQDITSTVNFDGAKDWNELLCRDGASALDQNQKAAGMENSAASALENVPEMEME